MTSRGDAARGDTATIADALAERYATVRKRTTDLAAPLSAEDQQVQPMADASPTKWHLAHTTWFFEALVLGREGARAFDPAFGYLFNSYYDAIGARLERSRRGLVSRPSLAAVHAYRDAVDRAVQGALRERSLDRGAMERLELGLHHEQQHQELILTDIKYVLGTSPLQPAYREDLHRAAKAEATASRFRLFEGGEHEIGAPANAEFSFDNERPRHRVLTMPFKLATRPVTNGDVIAFIRDGGYREPRHWLSDGWTTVQHERWSAPLYWEERDGVFHAYDLGGVRLVDSAETACHLSLYEADAIARWSGARLPTEAEWEIAAAGSSSARGHFAEDDRLHPTATHANNANDHTEESLAQMFGDVWEWTASSYAAYPGFRPLAGALGEYNGKFMSGQHVLRGGSCFTPRGHVRASYRNFFPPSARWQMTGIRLAADAD